MTAAFLAYCTGFWRESVERKVSQRDPNRPRFSKGRILPQAEAVVYERPLPETLLDLYHGASDRRALLREPLRQWLRGAMARLAAHEAQLTGEEGQP